MHGPTAPMPPRTLAWSVYIDAPLGQVLELPRAGSPLEHPLVFDDAARQFQALAAQGRVELITVARSAEAPQDAGFERVVFRRLR